MPVDLDLLDYCSSQIEYMQSIRNQKLKPMSSNFLRHKVFIGGGARTKGGTK